MRNLILTLAVLGAVVSYSAGCGPSAKQVAMAKTARYQGDKLVLFGAVKAATEAKHKLLMSDETRLGLATTKRWHNEDGLALSANPDDVRDVPNKSLLIQLVVELLPENDSWVVAVKPVVSRRFTERPNLDVLEPNDPSMPGWVTSRVDQLQLEIHTALKQYEVQGVGGMAPPPAADPVVDPAVDPAAPGAAPGATEPAPAADPAAPPA